MTKKGKQAVDPMDALNERQRLFVEAYARHFNGAQAYRDAEYKPKSNQVAAVAASRLLRNVKIKDALRKLYQEHTMSTHEVLRRFTEWAEGDVTKLEEVLAEKTVPEALTKARELGVGTLIKEIGYDKFGAVQIKIHDPTHAAELIGKHQGMFRTKVDVTHRDVSELSDEELEELACG